jgi:hypothetical protein
MARKRKCFNCGKSLPSSENYDQCPFCGCHEKCWDIGKEEFQLFRLQKEWIKNGRKPNDENLAKMYPLLELYSVKIIKKNARGKIFLSGDVIRNKAHDMTTDLIEELITKPNFEILSKWQGILFRKFQKVFYNYRKKKREQTQCSLDLMYEESNKPIQEYNDFDNFFRKNAHPDILDVTIKNNDDLIRWVMNELNNSIKKVNKEKGILVSIYFLRSFYYRLLGLKNCFLKRYDDYIGNSNYTFIDKLMGKLYTSLKKDI